MVRNDTGRGGIGVDRRFPPTYSFKLSRGGHCTACRRHVGLRRVFFETCMDTLDTQTLEEKIDQLIGICNRLDDENRALRERQASLIAERASLVEKSELARSRVEAMIARLRAMELDT